MILSYINKYFLRLLLILVLSALTTSVYAQEIVPVNPDKKQTSVFLGVLLYKSDQEPLYGGVIKIKGTTVATLSDENGRFDLTIPAAYMEKQSLEFQFSYVGTQSITVSFPPTAIPVDKVYYLEDDQVRIEEIRMSKTHSFPDPIYDKPEKRPRRIKKK